MIVRNGSVVTPEGVLADVAMEHGRITAVAPGLPGEVARIYIGAKFRGVVRCTVLRGEIVFVDGNIVGEPRGRMVATRHATTGIHA